MHGHEITTLKLLSNVITHTSPNFDDNLNKGMLKLDFLDEWLQRYQSFVNGTGARFTNYFSIAIQIRWKNSFHSHLDSNTVIATKFCTWHDSCAVVACAKICCDLMASNGVMARQSFHRIWIVGKKPLVKIIAPAPMSPIESGKTDDINNENTTEQNPYYQGHPAY